jgi:large subunit ribosomal protein L14e
MVVIERFVEPGRLVKITYGSNKGKLATIVDIIDNNRVLIDGPRQITGVKKQQIPVRWFEMTTLVTELPCRGCKESELIKALEENDTLNKWRASPEGIQEAKAEATKNMNDFER